MVIDFHELDEVMIKAIEPFEHRHINEVPPFDEINPSAENLAWVIGDAVKEQLRGSEARFIRCDVWENDLSRATYINSDDQ